MTDVNFAEASSFPAFPNMIAADGDDETPQMYASWGEMMQVKQKDILPENANMGALIIIEATLTQGKQQSCHITLTQC